MPTRNACSLSLFLEGDKFAELPLENDGKTAKQLRARPSYIYDKFPDVANYFSYEQYNTRIYTSISIHQIGVSRE